MSDADEFDKEAEREKLREKFAEDDAKREHTQRMSELLLKGATMTNTHCDRCGDPIFRHDGQEFCPSCNAPGSEATDAADSGTPGASTGDAAGAAGATGTAGAAGATGTAGASDVSEQRGQPGQPGQSGQPGEARTGSTAPARQPEQGTRTDAHSADKPGEAGTGELGGRERSDAGSPVAGVADARASLVRTLTKFARAAEETDDPRRAREQLRAAREAAETLAALE